MAVNCPQIHELATIKKIEKYCFSLIEKFVNLPSANKYLKKNDKNQTEVTGAGLGAGAGAGSGIRAKKIEIIEPKSSKVNFTGKIFTMQKVGAGSIFLFNGSLEQFPYIPCGAISIPGSVNESLLFSELYSYTLKITNKDAGIRILKPIKYKHLHNIADDAEVKAFKPVFFDFVSSSGFEMIATCINKTALSHEKNDLFETVMEALTDGKSVTDFQKKRLADLLAYQKQDREIYSIQQEEKERIQEQEARNLRKQRKIDIISNSTAKESFSEIVKNIIPDIAIEKKEFVNGQYQPEFVKNYNPDISMLQTFFNIPEKRDEAFFDTEGSEIEGDEEYNIFEERDRTMVDVRHQLKRMHKTKYARWKEKAQTGFEQVKKGKPRVKEFNEKRRDLWLDQRRLDQLYSLLGQQVKPSLVPRYIEKILDIEKFIRSYHNEIIESPLTEFRPYIHCVDAFRIISLTHETNILYDVVKKKKKFLFASRFFMIDEINSIEDLNIFCLPKQRKFKNNFRIMQHVYTGDRGCGDRHNNNPEAVYCDDFVKIDGRSGFIYKYDNLDAINMNKNRIKRKKAQEHINIIESFLENFEPGDWKNRSSKQAGNLMLNLSRQKWFDKLAILCIKAIDMLFFFF